ncbi:hypothetical protein Sipo8835_01385 [Streptomyces ipomoeae]|jgi:type II secretory pathway pseudopilin PulG|uniref:Uncharacterized protein n=1 Tax=Streptomyces ipomoeae TaxID=103232 RepID=A0A540QF93_9ACTN|nr:hypothetical protein [Streptomyces ipomoeae]MDX2693281.1 hypothetical protein [Streptomyces ipomoeae]MDX2820679.1 hypothetical protein [Streptomyces ipomoeae]MDX2838762.1 hypothetical protein [Streptomyces ipomoeae]MDX2873186.1 hypothetical protein [Streptomyces ipomoeae]MDX2934181.1 hypothetical protein [Streptomyces ipomoeae]
MNETQTQTLIGTLVVLGMLALVILPAVIGAVRDRRVDRQLRDAERREAAIDGTVREAYARTDVRGASSHRMARAA